MYGLRLTKCFYFAANPSAPEGDGAATGDDRGAVQEAPHGQPRRPPRQLQHVEGLHVGGEGGAPGVHHR